jgi:hypothetical protein
MEILRLLGKRKVRRMETSAHVPPSITKVGLEGAEAGAERETLASAPLDSDRAVIVRTLDERDLRRIVDPHVAAVIYEPQAVASWLAPLAAAVESGVFVVPRTLLPNAGADEIAAWLATHLPDCGAAPDVREALVDDIRALVARVAEGTGASRFMLRIFTAAPTTECGFHVDTVPPGAPPWGLLRVYNGAGTRFVEPDNVTSLAEFYRYLGRRERLERERRVARGEGNADDCHRLEREIAQLDGACAFLKRPDDIPVAPAGAIVAFKHLDVRLHWTAHAKAKAWIHCSPMRGVPRLVVNVSSPERARRQSGRGAGTSVLSARDRPFG